MSQAMEQEQDQAQDVQPRNFSTVDELPSLTAGLVSYVYSDELPADDPVFASRPVLQFLTVKKLNSHATNNNMDRYRVIVSDGQKFMQAMLASQLNYMAQEDLIGKYTVARIDKFLRNNLQSHRVLILLQLTVLGRTEDKIDSPVNIDQPGGQSQDQAIGNQNPFIPPAQQQQAQSSIHQVQSPAQASSSRSGNQAAMGQQRLVFPIESLNPYQNKWTIKARVTMKSDIRHWSNNKGEGKLFNVTLMDESGEIRGTAFNTAVDELYDKMQEGKVYYISKARVNLAKKKFSNISNEYELSLDRGTEVEECLDTTNLPEVKYNFVKFSELESCPKDSNIDVCGIIKEASPISEIVSKTSNRPITKRELTLVDDSSYSVRLTLWGKQAEQYSAEDQAVAAFKGVKVGDFGGRSLSMVSGSTMTVNPDIPNAHFLRGWFDGEGNTQQFQSHNSNFSPSTGSAAFKHDDLVTLGYVKENRLGEDDKVEVFSARATIIHIKTENLTYPACKNEGCSKKVIEGSDGWRCEKCDMSFSEPQYRYIMSMSVADYTASAWMQGFNDVGMVVFGMSANELMGLKERDEAAYNTVLHKANCNTYNFTCRAKSDTYNETTRVRYGIQKILPLDYRAEAGVLCDLLNSDWAK